MAKALIIFIHISSLEKAYEIILVVHSLLSIELTYFLKYCFIWTCLYTLLFKFYGTFSECSQNILTFPLHHYNM
jgi:hypothetical protein